MNDTYENLSHIQYIAHAQEPIATDHNRVAHIIV